MDKKNREKLLIVIGRGEKTKTSVIIKKENPNKRVKNFFDFDQEEKSKAKPINDFDFVGEKNQIEYFKDLAKNNHDRFIITFERSKFISGFYNIGNDKWVDLSIAQEDEITNRSTVSIGNINVLDPKELKKKILKLFSKNIEIFMLMAFLLIIIITSTIFNYQKNLNSKTNLKYYIFFIFFPTKLHIIITYIGKNFNKTYPI